MTLQSILAFLILTLHLSQISSHETCTWTTTQSHTYHCRHVNNNQRHNSTRCHHEMTLKCSTLSLYTWAIFPYVRGCRVNVHFFPMS